MLPEMSGTEVCRQLRQRSARADHHGHRPGQRDRQGGRAGDRRRRLRHQAVLAARAGRPDPGRAAPPGRRGGRGRPRRRWPPARSGWTWSGTWSPSTATSVQLPLKEFELLELLLRNAGRVLTRGQLIDRVWGADYVGDTKTLDVHVKRLRSKVEPEPSTPRYIVTVRGLGYKFEPVGAGQRRRGARARGRRASSAAPAAAVAGCVATRPGRQRGPRTARPASRTPAAPISAVSSGRVRHGTSARCRRAPPATRCTTSRRSWPPAPQPRRSNSVSVGQQHLRAVRAA